jgi:transposase
VYKTWAPVNHPPVLYHRGSWEKISTISAVTFDEIYFQVVKGSIRQDQIIKFIKYIHRVTGGGKILIIWDRLQAHRAKKMRSFCAESEGKILIEYLPAYAPELNPVEYLWGRWKKSLMGNFCPESSEELLDKAKRTLGKMKRQKNLVDGFWRQAHLA